MKYYKHKTHDCIICVSEDELSKIVKICYMIYYNDFIFSNLLYTNNCFFKNVFYIGTRLIHKLEEYDEILDIDTVLSNIFQCYINKLNSEIKEKIPNCNDKIL